MGDRGVVVRDDVPITVEAEGVEVRASAIGGGMDVSFVTVPPGVVLASGHRSSRPHWGYLLRGRMKQTTSTSAGPVFYEAGQAFYLAPGDPPEALEPTEYLDFSPTEGLTP